MIAATGSHDVRELPWFLEVRTKTYDDLDDPSVEGRVMMLDAPLAAALMNTLPMQLRNRVAQLESSALNTMDSSHGQTSVMDCCGLVQDIYAHVHLFKF